MKLTQIFAATMRVIVAMTGNPPKTMQRVKPHFSSRFSDLTLRLSARRALVLEYILKRGAYFYFTRVLQVA